MSVVVNVCGAAALLLWGLHMVSTGVDRTFGASLRRWISLSAGTRLRAAGTGLAVTVALQSSTATCLMSAAFVASGLMGTTAAQAIMLGANVGTSLVAKALTFDIGPLSALLVLAGVVLFRSGEGQARRLARILIGLGLMLLSLHLLDLATEPLRESPAMRQILHDLDGLPLVGLAFAAALALMAHSSIAAILLILPLAEAGAFSPEFGLAMILGANLGSALSPVLDTGGDRPLLRRVPVGNLIVRLSGCVAAFPFLPGLTHAAALTSADAGARLINAHVAFNVVLALAFLPLVGPMGRLLARLLPERPATEDPRQPKYLDDTALDVPAVALGAATRETLRIADIIEDMLLRSQKALRAGDAKTAASIAEMDNQVDALHQAVKLYLARLSNEDLGEEERRRASDIVTFAINLEHIGDIIDRNIRDLAAKKIKHRLTFSREGFADITALFEQTLENLKMATAVFISGDIDLARRLLSEKAEVRVLEKAAMTAHLSRLSGGRRESIETSTLHLDILRDLKRINAHIASVAYPILEERGELENTRLRNAS